MRAGIRWSVALALLLGWQVSAEASTVWRVDFTLTVEQVFELTDPPLPPGSYVQPSLGEQFFGQIVYSSEELSGVGSEQLLMLRNKGPHLTAHKFGILSVTVNYYTDQVSDRDSEVDPWLPIIYFQDGIFKGMDFGSSGRLGLIDISNDMFKIYFSPAGDDLAGGSVSYGTPMAVPTPAAVGAGMMLLTVWGLKRRRDAA